MERGGLGVESFVKRQRDRVRISIKGKSREEARHGRRRHWEIKTFQENATGLHARHAGIQRHLDVMSGGVLQLS